MVICGEVISWPNKEDTLHCIFEAEITSGTPVLNPKHTSAKEIVWLPIAELASKHIYPNVGHAILQLQAGELSYYHIGRIDQPFVK
jgi:8-oxo-dGTP diphosphatase